jgi:hypothetical protein
MIRKTFSYILIFSFLLTASGCYTTKYYSDTPEVLISKEQGMKGVVYQDLDSMTLISNKTFDLSEYSSWFSKDRKDNSYKFIYYHPRQVYDSAKMLALKTNKPIYKDIFPDTLDIRYISFLHYSKTEFDKSRTLKNVGYSVLIPVVAIGLLILIFAPHMHFKNN